MTEFSADVLGKADDLLKAGKVRQDEQHQGVWWVEASGGSKDYRVQVHRDEHGRASLASCTCPNGTRKGQPTCKHVAAVLGALRESEHGPVCEECEQHLSKDEVALSLSETGTLLCEVCLPV